MKNSKQYGLIVSEHILNWASKDNYNQTRTFPKYTIKSEDEFWNTADSFRDPNVWTIEQDNKWYKPTLWGSYESFGDVNLSKDKIEKYKSNQLKIKNNK